ncbi:hypothetical protein RINTHH_14010 [Richelia intracellularis HH01]|uniref:Uncharacterized protein n=1 Tax=Richelia intracellularis HH01 TaxID=1165094 RepID=M1X5R0_9NOST|nr:hypothetical protein RINTHH_14010 [Richelia intracellularis HH01]
MATTRVDRTTICSLSLCSEEELKVLRNQKYKSLGTSNTIP